MRILHTSDWHLGRAFHGASLLHEQAEVVDRVVAITADRSVDLVIIAGDLYDRAIPPAAAVDLFDDALARLHATGAQVVAISGNHDSSVRVGVNDRLLNVMGVAVRGQVGRIAEPLVLTHPSDGGPPVAVYLLPYLEPSVDIALLEQMAASPAPHLVAATAPRGHAPEPPRPGHDRAVRLATEIIRRHLASLGPIRSVLVAHAFVAGGRVSESERDLSVGGAERVAVDAFDGFDLVALGHLHQPQSIDGDRVAYSGTPLPYSFSEEGQTKSVRIVHLAPDGAVAAEIVPLEVGRPLRTLTGTLEELLQDASFQDAAGARVRACLTDPHLPTQAMARLRQRFPHAVELRHQPAGVDGGARSSTADVTAVEASSPLELTLRFWAEVQGAEATGAERAVLERAVAASLAGPP